MMIIMRLIGLGGIALLISPLIYAAGNELIGRIDAVQNGDTIIIIDAEKKRHKIYMLGIDAPGMKQDFGIQAKAFLDKLLLTRNYQVKIIISRRTRAKNIVGTVFAAYPNSDQYTNINGMMVMSGHAWANKRTSKQYVAVEKIARKRKAGLWKHKKPQAPWLWRKKKK